MICFIVSFRAGNCQWHKNYSLGFPRQLEEMGSGIGRWVFRKEHRFLDSKSEETSRTKFEIFTDNVSADRPKEDGLVLFMPLIQLFLAQVHFSSSRLQRTDHCPLHSTAADALCLRPSLPAASIEAPWLRLGRAAVGWPRPTRCGTESSPPFLRTSTVKVRGGARVVAVTGGNRGVLEDWDSGSRDSGNLFPRGWPVPCPLCPLAVQMRSKQIQSDRQNLLKELDNLYNIEILRLPKALREMNWLEYFGKSSWSFPRPRPGALLWLPWQLLSSQWGLRRKLQSYSSPIPVSPPCFSS